jgi:hypothetical protein
MERVSSATAAEVDNSLDAISTDQSGQSRKKRAKVWAYVDSEIVDTISTSLPISYSELFSFLKCKYFQLPYS